MADAAGAQVLARHPGTSSAPHGLTLTPTPSRLIRALRRYPVTSLLLMPYMLLILPLAIAFSNPDTYFIVKVLAIAVVPAFVVEAILQPRGHAEVERTAHFTRSHHLLLLAKTVTIVGIIVALVRATLGAGSVFASTGRLESLPPIVTLIAPLAQWTIAGLGLLIGAHLSGMIDRRRLFRWIALALAAEVAVTMQIARTAPLASFVIVLTTLLLYCGLLTPRRAGIIGLAILVAWPTLFALRNEARIEGGVAVSSQVGAFDRLRYDLQITRAEPLGDSIDLDTPGLSEILRYGVVPRFLDSDRPELSTGTRLNVYLGGSSTSAFSFLPATNAYVLDGPIAMAAFYVFWAIGLAALLRHGRRVTPLRLMLFGLTIAGPLGWFTTYPDSSIGLIQGAVSTIPIAAALLLGERTSRSTRVWRSSQPRNATNHLEPVTRDEGRSDV